MLWSTKLVTSNTRADGNTGTSFAGSCSLFDFFLLQCMPVWATVEITL